MMDTFRPHVFQPLNIIHLLQRLGLFSRQRLFIIILPGPSNPVQEYPSRASVSEEVEDGKDENDKSGRAEGGEHANKNALAR